MVKLKYMRISVLTPSLRPLGLVDVQNSLSKQVFTDFEWLVELGIPGRPNDLNAAYNRLIRRSSGELIVSIQDYTSFGPELLLQLWQAYEENPTTFWTVDVAHTDGETVEYDWRHYRKGEPIEFTELEFCTGAFPRKGIVEIGGFDEELDNLTWGFDNVNVAFRAANAGFPLRVHPTAESLQFKHDLKTKHPFRDKMVPDLHNARLGQIQRGEVTVQYL